MKKIFILGLSALIAFASCKKNDDVVPENKHENEIVDGSTNDDSNTADNSPKYDKVKTIITYAEDGVTEKSRQKYEYDSQNREIGYKYYFNGVLAYESINYAYNGLTMTFEQNYYVNNEISSSTKYRYEYLR